MYEYGKDIIANTERMSLNKNVLNKKYYIIIPYYPEELSNGAFDKEEIKNLAFSELYTKAQSVIRTLAACQVGGKIMDSNELVDLLYVAYNRDESDVFGTKRALKAGFEDLYTTAPDVLDRKIKLLDKKIEEEAIKVASEAIEEARNDKEMLLQMKEQNMDDLILEFADNLIEENTLYIGEDVSADARGSWML